MSQPLKRALLWARQIGSIGVASTCIAVSTAAIAQPGPTVVEVRPGDTFSAIAAQFTGSATGWRRLYRTDLTGLSNPNVITAGMRFEVATDARGERYLRLLAPGRSPAADSVARRTAPPAGTAATAMAPTASAPSTVQATTPPAAPPSAASRELVIGVLPNIAAATLSSNYQRMTRYLERGNAHKVTVVIPRNFKEFFDATMRGDYDLAVAAPHFARIAQVDRNMIPLLMYQPQINALFVAPSDSTVAGAKDVRERVVAFANPQSLVAMYAQQWLKRAGLEAGTDYQTRPARTDLGVGRMLLSGDAVAAIMSNGEFRSLPPDELSRLKVVEVVARIPNFIVMAHPRLEGERLNRIKSQLLGFFADPGEGVPFGQASGFTSMVEVDDATMKELDAFAPATRRAMGIGN